MSYLRISAIAVALVAALTLSACGGDDDGDGGGGTEATSADTTFDGSWEGSTSQGKSISFTVSGGVVTELSIAWKYGGSTCGIVSNMIEGPAKDPIIDGKFTHKRPPLKGSFDSSGKASGTGHFETDPATEPGCKTSDITWQAQSSP